MYLFHCFFAEFEYKKIADFSFSGFPEMLEFTNILDR